MFVTGVSLCALTLTFLQSFDSPSFFIHRNVSKKMLESPEWNSNDFSDLVAS